MNPSLLLPMLLFATAGTHAADWTVVSSDSSLRFAGSAQGEAFEGEFKKFEAKIAFDPARLAGSRFEVTVDLASADTRNEERDGTLKADDFFDVAKAPQATYVAEQFAAKGAGFEAQGTLTLRGVSQPVALEFTWTPAASGAKLEGHAALDRTAFGIGGGDWADPEMIAHEVKVSTTLVLQPAS
jgi:polyisoprenoid-binding protein YceI